MPGHLPRALAAAALLVGGLCLDPPGIASADPVPRATERSPALGTALQRYRALDYSGALRLLDQALRSPLGDGERASALTHRAFCLIALGDEAAGQRAFEELLRFDPASELPPDDESPKFVELFRAARRAVPLQLSLAHDPGHGARVADGRARLVVRLIGTSAAAREVTAHVRRAGGGAFATVAMQPTGPAERVVELPTDGGPVEYYFVARSRLGREIARSGAPMAPWRVGPGAEAGATERPFYKRAWFWALVAVGVGAAVATPLVLGEGDSCAAGTLGPCERF